MHLLFSFEIGMNFGTFYWNIEEGFALKIITYFTLPYKTCSESSLWCQVGIGSTCSNLRDIPSVLIVLFWSYNSIIFFLMYTCLEFCWKVYIFFCILVAYFFLDIRSVIWYRFFLRSVSPSHISVFDFVCWVIHAYKTVLVLHILERTCINMLVWTAFNAFFEHISGIV